MALLKTVEQNKPGVRVAFGQEGPVLFCFFIFIPLFAFRKETAEQCCLNYYLPCSLCSLAYLLRVSEDERGAAKWHSLVCSHSILVGASFHQSVSVAMNGAPW